MSIAADSIYEGAYGPASQEVGECSQVCDYDRWCAYLYVGGREIATVWGAPSSVYWMRAVTSITLYTRVSCVLCGDIYKSVLQRIGKYLDYKKTRRLLLLLLICSSSLDVWTIHKVPQGDIVYLLYQYRKEYLLYVCPYAS